MVIHPRRDEVLWRAGGVLEGPRLEELERHLAAGCPGCERCAAESRAVIDALVLALRPSRPPASVKARLMARIEGDRRRHDGFTPCRTPQRDDEPSPSVSVALRQTAARPRSASRAIAAAIAVALVALFFYDATTHTPTKQPAATARTEQVAAPHRSAAEILSEFQRENPDGSLLLAMMGSASARFAAMTGGVERNESWGRLVWDRTGGAGLLYLTEMEGAVDGEDYRLWFVTDRGSVVPGGKVSGRDGWRRVWVPEMTEPIIRTALSYEPGEAESSPRSLLLSGSVIAWNEAEAVP